MKYLVDTNAWLGFFEGRENFGRRARETMESNPSSCWISVVTVWEAAIKRGLGKLKIDYDLQSEDVVTFNAGDVISVYVESDDAVWGNVITNVELTI